MIEKYKKQIIIILVIIFFTILAYFLSKKNEPETVLKRKVVENVETIKKIEKSIEIASTTKNEIILNKEISSTTNINKSPSLENKPKVIVKKQIIIKPEEIRKTTISPISTSSVVVKSTTTALITSCNEVSGGFAGQVESEINNVRFSYGLGKLIVCKELRNSSYQKYLDIVAQNNFTHEWAGGKKLYDVIVSSGYVPKKWGEILEYGSDFTTAREHVDNWMSSPTHKSIILDPTYTHFGVYVGGWNVEDTSVDMGIAHFGKK